MPEREHRFTISAAKARSGSSVSVPSSAAASTSRSMPGGHIRLTGPDPFGQFATVAPYTVRQNADSARFFSVSQTSSTTPRSSRCSPAPAPPANTSTSSRPNWLALKDLGQRARHAPFPAGIAQRAQPSQ